MKKIELNYKQLYYFYLVEKEGGVSKAAKVLGVSQPVVSALIKCLEKNTGVTLLERSGRTVKTTEKGKEVLNYCEKIFTIGEGLVECMGRK